MHDTLNQDIKDLLNLDQLASITSTLREVNNCADFLANLGAHDSLLFFTKIIDPPLCRLRGNLVSGL